MITISNCKMIKLFYVEDEVLNGEAICPFLRIQSQSTGLSFDLEGLTLFFVPSCEELLVKGVIAFSW